MSKVKIKVKAELSALQSQLRKDEKFSQVVRLYAVYQISKGKDAKELQELYSTSHKSICNWVHRYNAEGIEGLKDRPRSGRTPFLSLVQKSELEQIIQCNPQEYGYNTSTWTGAVIIDFVKKDLGLNIKNHRYTIFYILWDSVTRKGKAIFPKKKTAEKKLRI